ncbi:acetyltransferase, GNAT family [Pochonia chlamydosporia 170]|uniref:Acetyltransferase, GNAT family n=1 Tax=Pochonia chlamydosporia 170 TaxID=1380566 RepID=A0A179G9P3_METCM|nr:acetyltransferase, GNAT family [Pochonia chlamydosporia 170]OAQ74238.2 acetyltransferase, GNAT family [Pochonia chlamydosporia 170]
MGAYTPAPKVSVFTTPPEQLLDLLASQLPTSLTLLRRLQFALHRNFTTPDARIIFSSDIGQLQDASTTPKYFAVAYAEFSTGPDTQMVMYSSMEQGKVNEDEAPIHEEHIMNTVRELVRLRKEYAGKLVYGNSLLLGSLHSDVRAILIKHGRVTPRPSGDYDKWLFRMEDVPEPKETPDGMHWEKASLEDCRLVASRTDIPRPESLVQLPGLMLKLEDGTPVAWAFIGDYWSPQKYVHCC